MKNEKGRHEDNVKEIENLRRELRLLTENYEKLSRSYQDYRMEMEERVEKDKNEITEVREKFKEVIVELAEDKEKLKEVKVENEKLRESNDSLEMKKEEYREEVEREVEKSKVVRTEFQEKIKEVMVENEKLKEENKRLKETNDVQNRLWKVWLKEHDKGETGKDENKRMEKLDKELDVRVEEIDVENEFKEKEKEVYETQKVRGFKKRSEDSKGERYQNGEMKQERRKFCHFWNNGRCRYRDSECWFLHEESPVCRFGRECKVRRYMFYHPQRENWSSSQGQQHINHNQRKLVFKSRTAV